METIVLIGIACLIFLSVAVQHTGTILSRGIGFVMTDRSSPLSEAGFSGRARRTLQNNVKSALMMAPLATVLLVLGLGNPTTQIAGAVYLIARVCFCLAYWLGFSLVRSLSWGVGMAAVLTTFAVLVAALA